MLRTSRAPGVREFSTVIDAYMTSGGVLDDEQRRSLEALMDTLYDRTTRGAYQVDPVAYGLAWKMLKIARLLVATGKDRRWTIHNEGRHPAAGPRAETLPDSAATSAEPTRQAPSPVEGNDP